MKRSSPPSPRARRGVRLFQIVQGSPMRKIVGIGLLILTIIYYATSSPKKQDVLTVAYKGQSHDKNGGSRSLKYGRDLDEKESFNQFPKLLELNDRDRLWPPDLNKPLCAPKIYVYDLPPHLSLPNSKFAKCRWSAYSSELLLHNLLTGHHSSPSHSKYVTADATLADYFFIPLFPSCYLFNCWDAAPGWDQSNRCEVDEKYIIPVMAWVEEQKTWRKNQGKDHIIVHPMDRADQYYQESSRQVMNNSIYLVTVGDLRPAPYSTYYKRHRDIVIPSATHLINSYFINPMDYLDSVGNPLFSTSEAAEALERQDHQAKPTRAEIFNPSPNRAIRRSWWRQSGTVSTLQFDKGHSRNRGTAAVFRGGLGDPDEAEEYGLNIRSLFFPSSSSSSSFSSTSSASFSAERHPGFSSLPHYDILPSSTNEAYAFALSQSRYGLTPPGYTLDTTRLYEYLAFGVVPVFIGTGPHSGQVMPFQDDFDYDSFSLSISRDEAHMLPQILESVGEAKYERLRQRVWEMGRLLVLEEGRGNVLEWLARDLCRRM